MTDPIIPRLPTLHQNTLYFQRIETFTSPLLHFSHIVFLLALSCPCLEKKCPENKDKKEENHGNWPIVHF